MANMYQVTSGRQTYVGDASGNPNVPRYGSLPNQVSPYPMVDASPRGRGRYSNGPGVMLPAAPNPYLRSLPSSVQNRLGDADDSIPGYAYGGIAGLNGPELAMVGENGPELVTPLHHLLPYSGAPQQQQQNPQTTMRYQNVGLLPRGPSPQSDYAVNQRKQNAQYVQDANDRANIDTHTRAMAGAMVPASGRSSAPRYDPLAAAKSYTLMSRAGSGISPADAQRYAFANLPQSPSNTAGMVPNSYSDPHLANAASMYAYPGAATQPSGSTTYSRAPAPSYPGPTTRPSVPTVAQGGNPITFTEQHGREMLRNMAQNYPQMTLGELQPMWTQTLADHGIHPQQADALWNSWHQNGTLGKFDYAQGPMLPATQPRVDAAPNPQTGAGGLATLPNGQQIVVNAQGRRVGDPVGYGAPLPMVPSSYGAQPGYSPINHMLPNQPYAQQSAPANSTPGYPGAPTSPLKPTGEPRKASPQTLARTAAAANGGVGAGYVPPPGRGMGDFRTSDQPARQPAPAPTAQPQTLAARPQQQQQRTPTTGPARMTLGGKTYVISGYRNGEPMYAPAQ